MLSFKEENRKFNYRVGAIILSNDKSKVLLHTIAGFGFYLLPGGRVEWMETTEDAIKRELAEELGLTDISPKMRLHLEDFFEFGGVEYHEISNNFVVELTEKHKDLEMLTDFYGLEGEKYIYKWVPISELENYIVKPELLKQTIKDYLNQVEFKVLEERQP